MGVPLRNSPKCPRRNCSTAVSRCSPLPDSSPKNSSTKKGSSKPSVPCFKQKKNITGNGSQQKTTETELSFSRRLFNSVLCRNPCDSLSKTTALHSIPKRNIYTHDQYYMITCVENNTTTLTWELSK